MTIQPTPPPAVETKPTGARDAQRAIQDALRNGQPVFVQASQGNVIGFQPYTTNTPIAIATVAARDTDGTTLIAGPTFRRAARDLVHVSGLHSGPAPVGDRHTQWTLIDEIAITVGGRIVVVDARRHNEAIVTGCNAYDVGYATPLAEQWRTTEAARHTEPAAWHSPLSDSTDFVRDALGDIYAIHTARDGEITVIDLSASEAAGTPVTAFSAELHWEGRALVIESATRVIQTAPITELDPTHETVTPLAAEFVVRQRALLDRAFGPSARQPGLTLER